MLILAFLTENRLIFNILSSMVKSSIGHGKKHMAVTLRILWQKATASSTIWKTLRFSFLCDYKDTTSITASIAQWWSTSCNTWNDWYTISALKQQPGFPLEQVVGHLPSEVSRFTNYIPLHLIVAKCAREISCPLHLTAAKCAHTSLPLFIVIAAPFWTWG